MGGELAVKREFRRVVGVWSEVYESRSGSGTGYPDLQLLVGRMLMPVELKVGRIVRGRLKVSRIRPSQIAWHDGFRKAGGRSWIVAGMIGEEGLEAWALPSVERGVTSEWKAGYPMGDCNPWIIRGQMVKDLNDLSKS